MELEPLGWTVKRHVVDMTVDEFDLPRRVRVERYVVVGQAPTADTHAGRTNTESVASGAGSGGPFPAP